MHSNYFLYLNTVYLNLSYDVFLFFRLVFLSPMGLDSFLKWTKLLFYKMEEYQRYVSVCCEYALFMMFHALSGTIVI